MAFEIVVDTAAQILRARYTGEVGLEERMSLGRRVLEEAERTGIYRILLDFRAAHARVGNTDDVGRMADMVAPSLPSDARLAYLMRYQHQDDEAVGDLVRTRGVEVERFTNPDVALAWLQEDRPGGQPEPPAGDPEPNRAYRLVADAIDPAIQLSPRQFAALGELAQELLGRGVDDATVRQITLRMSGAMDPRKSP